MKRLSIIIMIALLIGTLGGHVAWAAPTMVSIDLSGLGGRDMQVEIALYDNSGVVGDSWVLIDNVRVGSVVDDFEDGTLGVWDRSWNPGSVAVVPGSVLGGGNYVLLIDEDPVFTPTFVFRDYLSPDGSVLSFDFQMHASDQKGFFGLDEFVVSLLDPVTLEPLVAGLSGFGDVLSVKADGIQHTDEVSVTVIPAPGALLLSMIGLSGMGLWRRKQGRSR